MSYEIIIKERRTVVRTSGKKWDIVGTKEVARDETFYRHDKDEPKTRIENVMGYTPEIEREEVEEREVLKQAVDTLDLAAVICAINGLANVPKPK